MQSITGLKWPRHAFGVWQSPWDQKWECEGSTKLTRRYGLPCVFRLSSRLSVIGRWSICNIYIYTCICYETWTIFVVSYAKCGHCNIPAVMMENLVCKQQKTAHPHHIKCFTQPKLQHHSWHVIGSYPPLAEGAKTKSNESVRKAFRFPKISFTLLKRCNFLQNLRDIHWLHTHHFAVHDNVFLQNLSFYFCSVGWVAAQPNWCIALVDDAWFALMCLGKVLNDDVLSIHPSLFQGCHRLFHHVGSSTNEGAAIFGILKDWDLIPHVTHGILGNLWWMSHQDGSLKVRIDCGQTFPFFCVDHILLSMDGIEKVDLAFVLPTFKKFMCNGPKGRDTNLSSLGWVG